MRASLEDSRKVGEMSVEYYFACRTCRKCIHVAQDGFSGFGFYTGESKCMRAFPAFLEEHRNHDVRFVMEQTQFDPYNKDDPNDLDDYEEVDWDFDEPLKHTKLLQALRPDEEAKVTK